MLSNVSLEVCAVAIAASIIQYHLFPAEEAIVASPTYNSHEGICFTQEGQEWPSWYQRPVHRWFQKLLTSLLYETNSAKQARNALQIQLDDVPLEAHDKIIKRAVLDSIMQKSMLQDLLDSETWN